MKERLHESPVVYGNFDNLYRERQWHLTNEGSETITNAIHQSYSIAFHPLIGLIVVKPDSAAGRSLDATFHDATLPPVYRDETMIAQIARIVAERENYKGDVTYYPTKEIFVQMLPDEASPPQDRTWAPKPESVALPPRPKPLYRRRRRWGRK